tara:strand:- start:2911 stop:4695 length:1785 start_codon:yes stop_codon:yes gene_type:complete
MAKYSVDMLINAQDNASKKFGNVAESSSKMGSKVQSSLDGASRSLKGMSSAVDKTSDSFDEASRASGGISGGLQGVTGSLKGMIGPLAAIGAGFLAFSTIKGIISGGIEAFAIQEKAVMDLATTMHVLGDETETAMGDLMSFASELQALTNVGDEVTLGTMKRLRTLGFEQDELKGATQAAIGLTAAFGSQEAAVEAVAKAHEGDFDALKEKIPALREANTLAEKTAIVNQAAADGFIVASEGTKTMGGALTALNNAWGDTLESVGSLLAPYITRVADMFNRIAPIIQEKIGMLLPVMEHIAQRVAEISFWIFKQMVKAYTMIETVIMNFGDVVSGVWSTIKLAALMYVNQVVHNFTVALPMAGKWFVDNFGSIMTDLFNLLKTLVVNYVKMYVDNFMFLIEFVKSGFSGGMGAIMDQVGKTMGTNLIEGFVATTQPLPDIMKRELTATEKELMGEVANSAVKVGSAYSEAVSERLGFFDDLFSADLGAGAKAFQGIGVTEGAKRRDKEQQEKDKDKDKDKEKSKLSAKESRFLTKGGGNQVAPEEQMVEEQKQAKKVLKDVATGMAEAVDFLGKIFNKESGGDIEIIQSLKGG